MKTRKIKVRASRKTSKKVSRKRSSFLRSLIGKTNTAFKLIMAEVK